MQLQFLGAAQEVTGSCHYVQAGGARFVVDCGMFQGGREAPARNRRAWPFDPRELDFVLLTHAHIDHSGLIPRLCAQGFRGPVYCTAPTADLLPVLLLDSAHIQEMAWTRAQRRAARRSGGPERGGSELLYTVAQAQACLEQVDGRPYDEWLQPHPAVRARFRDAGHILGSASIEIDLAEQGRRHRLVVSGDLGQPGRPIVRDPAPIEQADTLLVESTYGNRLHRPLKETVDELVEVIDGTLRRRKGNIVIPAFALGRTQELLHMLGELRRERRLPPMKVFVDSPMADRVTAITWRHTEALDDAARRQLAERAHATDGLSIAFTQSPEESMALNRIRSGAIVIAASGMCDAGRIQHHLRHNLGRPECAVVIVGWQAEGTLGRRLVDGARRVRILGDDVAVRAGIHTIGGLSAHADQAALLGWLAAFRAPPKQTYVVHGEAQTAEGFAALLNQKRGWRARAPSPGEVVALQ